MRALFPLGVLVGIAIAYGLSHFGYPIGPSRQVVYLSEPPVADEGPRLGGDLTHDSAPIVDRMPNAPVGMERHSSSSFVAEFDTKGEDLDFDVEFEDAIEALHAQIAEEMDEHIRIASEHPAPQRLNLSADEALAEIEREMAEALERAEAEADAAAAIYDSESGMMRKEETVDAPNF